jgi:DNA-binding transcriptional ArsR family regulator
MDQSQRGIDSFDFGLFICFVYIKTRCDTSAVTLPDHRRSNSAEIAYSTIWLTFAQVLRDLASMAKALDTVFSALADPTRRDILAMLLEDDMAVTDVAEPFEMSLAAVSKHLTILSRAGLISQEKRGRVKWCKLEPDSLRDASIWMQSFGQFEAVNLDAFERFLENELPSD